MRSDMKKLIVERPRYNPGGMNRIPRSWKNYRNDPELFQDNFSCDKESMRKPYSRGWTRRKEFSDNLQPLFRWLLSKVGMKWDDVYSEFREQLKMDSTLQYHIWSHFRDMVTTSPMYIGKDFVVDENGKSGTYQVGPILYVEDGILKRKNLNKSPQQFSESFNTKYEVKRVNSSLVVKISGIWYMLEMRKVDLSQHQYDVVTKWNGVNSGFPLYKKPLDSKNNMYAHSKRQMSTKELKNNNLRNDQYMPT